MPVCMSTSPLFLGPCEPDWADTVQVWLHSCRSVAPDFLSCSTVSAVLAKVGAVVREWERELPEQRRVAGVSLRDSLVVIAVSGLWEHTRSLCGSHMGDAGPRPQESFAVLWCLHVLITSLACRQSLSGLLCMCTKCPWSWCFP